MNPSKLRVECARWNRLRPSACRTFSRDSQRDRFDYLSSRPTQCRARHARGRRTATVPPRIAAGTLDSHEHCAGSGCLLGRPMLRLAVARATGAERDAIEITWHVDGRARVAARHVSAPRLSLSHSGGWVACAVHPVAAIGLDIECKNATRDFAGIGALAFGADEQAWLLRQPERSDAFYRLWTGREALTKLGAELALPTSWLGLADGTLVRCACARCRLVSYRSPPGRRAQCDVRARRGPRTRRDRCGRADRITPGLNQRDHVVTNAPPFVGTLNRFVLKQIRFLGMTGVIMRIFSFTLVSWLGPRARSSSCGSSTQRCQSCSPGVRY